MNKLTAFVRLDFITIKPYFTVKNLLIYAVVALFLTTMSESGASAISVGMMFGTMFLGYPFALGEKSNMDALYATLSVGRKTVVSGRYIFALMLNACAALFSVVLSSVGLIIRNLFEKTTGMGELSGTLMSVLILVALCLFLQSIQLPVYFKLGYTKANFLSFIPIAALMAGYLIILRLPDIIGAQSVFLANILTSGMIMPIFAVVMMIIVFISYRLSLAFYRKREF